MKKFVNPALEAPNVFTVPVDPQVTAELTRLATSKMSWWRLYSKSPPWPSDIRWYSARWERVFKHFETIFNRLNVARHVEPFLDLRDSVRLYNAQFVVRRVCTEPRFHVDWHDTNNEAFTLMTPLTENCAGFGMLYKKTDGSIGEYDYKVGEAIIFGDDFLHSTKPGAADEPVALLCLNFGTDKMKHWPKIERTVARQCLLTCRPDGSFQRLNAAQRMRNFIGPILRRVGLLPQPPSQSTY